MVAIYRSVAYVPRFATLLAATFLISGSPTARAQADEEPPPTREQMVEIPDSLEGEEWDVGLAGKLSGSQVAYNNWQEGGLSTLAVTSTLDGQAVHASEHWIQTYELRLAFGLVQQDTLDVRKSDDLIRLGVGLQYRGEDFWQTFRPTVATVLRTQFASGFSYDEDPFGTDRPPPVKTSEFFAPAVFTQSIGLTYEPTPWIATRLGMAGRGTFVVEEDLRVLYDVDPERSARVEGGIESETTIDREVFTNVWYQSRLNLFQSVTRESEPLDVLWENVVTMKVNGWLNVGFEYVMLYDVNRSDAVQIKEVLSVGVAFVLL